MDKMFDSLQDAISYCIQQGINPMTIRPILSDDPEKCDGFVVPGKKDKNNG